MDFILFDDTLERFTYPSIARVEETITPTRRGRGTWRGTSWFAQFYDPAVQGSARCDTVVLVFARQGNTLLIVPLDCYSFHASGHRVAQLATTQSPTLLQAIGSILGEWFS